jgi:hypothetical protein
LIDVTFNAYIGLWFAVEQQFENGSPVHENVDGRVFAIDVTKRLINEDDDRRSWEDDLRCPWRTARMSSADWQTTVWAWKPSRYESRIAAQNGGFLFGGVPGSESTRG